MSLDLATVLVQWAAGGMLSCWVTTRHRVVGLGFGWLLRAVYATLAVGGLVAGLGASGTGATVREILAAGMTVTILGALARSIARRAAGTTGPGSPPPLLDLLAGVVGLVAMTGAAADVGGPYALSLTRLLVGAVFLGAVTDAMLLGHWYLVQPGLGRQPIRELTRLVGWVWPFEVLVFLLPTGMISVLDGSINDGYGGIFGWMWVVAAVTTIGLVVMTWFALRERSYAAVMAATGLLYLAILTGAGTDLLAHRGARVTASRPGFVTG